MIWGETSLKKMYRWQVNIWKDVLFHMLIKNFKLKQRDTTIYLLIRSKKPKKTLTSSNAGKDVEQQELSFIASWNAKWHSHFGIQDSVPVPYKTKHTLTIWSSNWAPWYLPKSIENSYPQKQQQKPAIDVNNSFIHYCPNLETTKMYFKMWMDKWTMVCPDNGISFGSEKKWTIKPWEDTKET